MKWTNSYRSFGLKTKRSTGLKTIEHKHLNGEFDETGMELSPEFKKANTADADTEVTIHAIEIDD